MKPDTYTSICCHGLVPASLADTHVYRACSDPGPMVHFLLPFAYGNNRADVTGESLCNKDLCRRSEFAVSKLANCRTCFGGRVLEAHEISSATGNSFSLSPPTLGLLRLIHMSNLGYGDDDHQPRPANWVLKSCAPTSSDIHKHHRLFCLPSSLYTSA